MMSLARVRIGQIVRNLRWGIVPLSPRRHTVLVNADDVDKAILNWD